ncbi:endonuclease [Methylophaga sp.]|uniref:endonuclease n=1 Tax=Methylophaga sp. TaxID=2024840 RepID=UPI0014015CC8|nr:endonuclease [Methylophaga sp.]MTI62531.1 endonuclease I [Methylophaga sp.]
MKGLKTVFLLAALLLPFTVAAEPTDSFSKAKKLMMERVYFDHRETLYCGAKFDAKKDIALPTGFHTDKYIKRSKRLEWEHVVPAENFGRTFSEWRDGHPNCIDSKGKAFKGRNCASKVSIEYRYMQSDLYNLYPAIGAVNAMRSNYNFTMMPDAAAVFGTCQVKIDGKKVEPPMESRGQIARTYLYMEQRYPRYRMSKSQKQLMTVWNSQYPVTSAECKRADRIAAIQGNENRFVSEQCQN